MKRTFPLSEGNTPANQVATEVVDNLAKRVRHMGERLKYPKSVADHRYKGLLMVIQYFLCLQLIKKKQVHWPC